jgi:hypothetical protein
MSSHYCHEELNRQAYIWKWEKNFEKNATTYWFCEFPKNAAYWKTLRSAEIARDMLNAGVTIPSIEGGSHVLTNFAIEKFADEMFVVFCTGPFIYTAGTSIGEA